MKRSSEKAADASPPLPLEGRVGIPPSAPAPAPPIVPVQRKRPLMRHLGYFTRRNTIRTARAALVQVTPEDRPGMTLDPACCEVIEKITEAFIDKLTPCAIRFMHDEYDALGGESTPTVRPRHIYAAMEELGFAAEFNIDPSMYIHDIIGKPLSDDESEQDGEQGD